MKTHAAPLIGLLADDLTSAADGAGPFLSCGLRACVGRKNRPLTSAEVIAVDMATRSQPVAEARQRASLAAAALDDARVLVKTVDSTLRGHVRAEIDAVFKASRRSRLVLAPAYPAAGRTTLSGVQLVGGVPVGDSTYALDPVHPVRGSRLSDLVPDCAANAVLLDAETQGDLNVQVAAIPDPEDVLWVGSPGLAIALSERIGGAPAGQHLPTCGGDVLVVVGSANAVSAEQAHLAAGGKGVSVLRAPSGRADPARTLAALTGRALSALETGRYGAILATGGETMEAILEALEVTCLDLAGEFEPGFPVGTAKGNGGSLTFGLKAGGFGAPDTLARAARRLLLSRKVLA